MTEKLDLPKEVVDSNWRDDIDYETYGTNKEEMEYVSPKHVSEESLQEIKKSNIGQKILQIVSKNQ